MRLALYQPDIPPNTGTILRTAACLGVGVDLIEPCGFPFDDRDLRRAGLDYLAIAALTRHASWDAFLSARAAGPSGRSPRRREDHHFQDSRASRRSATSSNPAAR